MNKKDIKKTLENALIHKRNMEIELYEYQLEEIVDDLKSSLIEDNDDYIFALTVNTRNKTEYIAAVVLI